VKRTEDHAARVDWPRVIDDLLRHGVEREDIGAAAGHSPTWVTRLRSGGISQPRFRNGCRLLRLWLDTMGRPIAEVPCIPPSSAGQGLADARSAMRGASTAFRW
jgi:hypothetical protein